MSSRQSRHQNYQQADLQRNNAFGHPAQDEEGTDRCVWQTKSGSQNIHDAVCFRSCLVVPLSARFTFLQDQTLSCCRSKSGDPIFVFSSLPSRGFTLYGRETPATTCYPSLIECVRFVSLPCVSCGGQGGGNF